MTRSPVASRASSWWSSAASGVVSIPASPKIQALGIVVASRDAHGARVYGLVCADHDVGRESLARVCGRGGAHRAAPAGVARERSDRRRQRGGVLDEEARLAVADDLREPADVARDDGD